MYVATFLKTFLITFLTFLVFQILYILLEKRDDNVRRSQINVKMQDIMVLDMKVWLLVDPDFVLITLKGFLL